MYLILTEQTYNQRITWLYWTPKGAFEPIGKYKKKKIKSRQPKFINNKFSVPAKNSSGILAAAKLCISFQKVVKVDWSKHSNDTS